MSEKKRYQLVGFVSPSYEGVGFRIPIFTDGKDYYLQEAVGEQFNERVNEYILYDLENNPPIISVDQDLSVVSIYDETIRRARPTYLFVTLDEENPIIIGQRDLISIKLRREISENAKINPLVRLEVLYFLGSQRQIIIEAIQEAAKFLEDEGFHDVVEWRAHEELKLEKGYIPLVHSNFFVDTQDAISNIDLNLIERKLEGYNFSRFERKYAIQDDLTKIQRFVSRVSKWEAGEISRCMRLLISLIAQVDRVLPRLDPLRLFLRVTYARCVFKRLEAHNKLVAKQRNASFKSAFLDQDKLEQFSVGASESFFRDLLVVLSSIAPAETKRGDFVPQSGGVVCVKDWERGILKLQSKDVYIQNNLKPTVFFNSGLNCGEYIYINVLQDGVTARGKMYIESFFNLIFPQEHKFDWDFCLGASNSWAAIFMTSKNCSRILGGGGWVVRQIEEILGLRRVTIIQKHGIASDVDQYSQEFSKLKHFVNNSWEIVRVFENSKYDIKLYIENVNVPQAVVKPLRGGVEFNPIKIITFYSMAHKVFGDKFKMSFVSKIGDYEIDLVAAANLKLEVDRDFCGRRVSRLNEVWTEIISRP